MTSGAGNDATVTVKNISLDGKEVQLSAKDAGIALIACGTNCFSESVANEPSDCRALEIAKTLNGTIVATKAIVGNKIFAFTGNGK